MNDIDARSVPVAGGQHYGEFRLASKADWRRVRVKGKDQLYPDAWEAECMAWRAAKAAGFGVIRSTGMKASKARTAAEQLFKPKHGSGNGEAKSLDS